MDLFFSSFLVKTEINYQKLAVTPKNQRKLTSVWRYAILSQELVVINFG